MKNLMIKFGITVIALTFGCVAIAGQTGGSTLNADSDAAAGLDLYAVAELFKDSENLEKFEQALNDPARGLSRTYGAYTCKLYVTPSQVTRTALLEAVPTVQPSERIARGGINRPCIPSTLTPRSRNNTRLESIVLPRICIT